MTEFADLVKAKDDAIAYDDECEQAEATAAEAHAKATAEHVESTTAREAAHKAIADVLAERGEHYLIDQDNGTLTVYKPHSELPGYLAVQPIPGTTKAAK